MQLLNVLPATDAVLLQLEETHRMVMLILIILVVLIVAFFVFGLWMYMQVCECDDVHVDYNKGGADA